MNMKKVIYVFALEFFTIVLFSFPIFFSQTAFSKEIESDCSGSALPGYSDLGIHFEGVFRNGDGSITFTNPTFPFGGKELGIQEAPEAICKLSGLDFVDSHSERAYMTDVVVILTKNGKYIGTNQRHAWRSLDGNYYEDNAASYLVDVTCRCHN